MTTYIERETYRNRLADLESWCQDERKPGLKQALEMFDEVPAADVAPVVHGRWIEDHDYLKCPECNVMVKWDFTFFDIGNWNFCPNCGAKMDGGEDAEG